MKRFQAEVRGGFELEQVAWFGLEWVAGLNQNRWWVLIGMTGCFHWITQPRHTLRLTRSVLDELEKLFIVERFQISPARIANSLERVGIEDRSRRSSTLWREEMELWGWSLPVKREFSRQKRGTRANLPIHQGPVE